MNISPGARRWLVVAVLLVALAIALELLIPRRERGSTRAERTTQKQDSRATEQAAEKVQTGLPPEGDVSAAETERVRIFMEKLTPDDRARIEPLLQGRGIRQRLAKMPPDFATQRGGKVYEVLRTYGDLQMLWSVDDQFAIENQQFSAGTPVTFATLKKYLAAGTPLYETGADALGNTYGPFTVDSIPRVPDATFNALSDVADDAFWSPFR